MTINIMEKGIINIIIHHYGHHVCLRTYFTTGEYNIL